MGQFTYFWYLFLKKKLRKNVSLKFINVFFKSINKRFKYLDRNIDRNMMMMIIMMMMFNISAVQLTCKYDQIHITPRVEENSQK